MVGLFRVKTGDWGGGGAGHRWGVGSLLRWSKRGVIWGMFGAGHKACEPLNKLLINALGCLGSKLQQYTGPLVLDPC